MSKAREIIINVKNIDANSTEAQSQFLKADAIITNSDLEVRVENDGIGPYEFWGFQGNDRGVDYLILEESEVFNLKINFSEDIPEKVSAKELMENAKEWFSPTRTYNYGSDECSGRS